jgi:hypothetical protein
MEHKEISHQEVKIYRALKAAAGEWRTSREIGKTAKVAARTVRLHMKRMVELRMVDKVELFPGYHYRLSSKAEHRNKDYIARLEAASEIFS